MSPDAKQIAGSTFGKWKIFNLEEETLPQAGSTDVDRGRSDWSPDGRWIVYDAAPDNQPGVYIVNVQTLTTRLLAKVAATARWSPDGKTLALALKRSNEILLLDVTKSLDLLANE